MPPYLTKWYKDKSKRMTLKEIVDGIRISALPERLTRLVVSAIHILSSNKEIKNKVILMAALLYVAVTFDACPDIIPYIGFLDDISVLAAAIKQCE